MNGKKIASSRWIVVGIYPNKVSGTLCSYRELSCVDEDGYFNYWSPLFYNGCKVQQHSLVYRGTADKFQSKNKSTAYVFSHKEKELTLFVYTRHDACNSTIYQTEHPRLIIKENSELGPLRNINNLSYIVNTVSLHYIVSDLNLDVKINYLNSVLNKCTREESELRNAVLNACSNPKLLAYALTGVSGYSAAIRGETAYIFRCTPVLVQTRLTGSCFHEFPVKAHPDKLA